MSSSETAIVSVVNDEFAAAYLVLLSSMLEHNPRFDAPIVVLSEPGGLRPSYRECLRTVYDRIEFTEAVPRYLRALQDSGQEVLGTPKRLLAAFLILEAFALEGFKRVVCLDADLICMGDLSDLFTCTADFAAVRALEPDTEFPRGFFNSGVLVIGSRHLAGPTYHDLTLHTRLDGADPKAGKADQALLNRYFYPHRVRWLPARFNVTKRLFPDTLEDIDAEVERRDVRLLHFVGGKPWTARRTKRDAGFTAVEALWHRACERYVPDQMVADLLDLRVRDFESRLLGG